MDKIAKHIACISGSIFVSLFVVTPYVKEIFADFDVLQCIGVSIVVGTMFGIIADFLISDDL